MGIWDLKSRLGEIGNRTRFREKSVQDWFWFKSCGRFFSVYFYFNVVDTRSLRKQNVIDNSSFQCLCGSLRKIGGGFGDRCERTGISSLSSKRS